MKFIDLFSGSLKKYLFLCFFLLTSFSCKDDPVRPPDNVEFSINVEDVSCIEAWISLKEMCIRDSVIPELPELII